MKIVEHLQTPYNDVHVWQRHDGVDFEVAGGTHATWTPGRIMTGYAWDALTAAALLKTGPAPRRILVLGLGGGTVIRQLRCFLPRIRITAVDIDPGMIALARRYMALDELDVNIITGDAYATCQQAGPRFDVIMDDVYLGQARDVARPETFDARLMEWLTARLARDGIVLANLVTGSGHKGAQRRARAAFRDRFATVRSVRSAKGFNETLAGGLDLAAPHALRRFDHCLTDGRDLALWQAIRIRAV